ncbi:MAG: hypothetical protein IJY23_02230 [Clostridia bacterium]|nr:hypothetical protein [Clostridia bacterium]
MDGRFLKFKSRLSKIRLTKSVMAGLAADFAFAGISLLLWDFGLLKMSPWICACIGFGAGCLAFAVLFLSLRFSDEELAIRLDERFALKERVQTMLEYGGEKGSVIELQREDAVNSLRGFDSKQLKFGRMWLYFLAIVLGAALLAVSLALIPSDEGDNSNDEPELAFAISEKQIAQLTELIENVKSSDMESVYKESVVSNLEELLSDLKTVELHREMVERVKSSIFDIEKTIDDSECIEELYEALISNQDDITNIVAEYLKAEEWADFSNISARLSAALKYSAEADEDVSSETMRDSTKKKLENTSAYVSLSLAFSDVPETEALYVALSRLVNVEEDNEIIGETVYGFAKIAEKLPDNTYDWSKTKIQTLLTVMEPEIYSAMEPELVNISVGDYATDRLYGIFGITKPQGDDDSDKDKQPEDTKPDDERGDGASAGDGHTYPTNDKVYDIGSDETVPYGNLWALYNDKINNVDDEEKKAIYQKYFQILFNGFDEKGDVEE